MPHTDKLNWFLERINKRVFPATKSNETCNICRRQSEEGVVVANRSHAESMARAEGNNHIIQYFDTKEEAEKFKIKQ